MESSGRLPVVGGQRRLRGLISRDCNNQVGGAIEVEALAGRDDRGRAVFRDDGGAGIVSAGAEVVSVVNLRGVTLFVELHLASWTRNPAELCSARTAGGGRPHTNLSCAT